MAEFSTIGMNEIIESFKRQEKETVAAVPKMVKAGAAVLVEAQKAELKAMGIEKTGGLIKSIKATKVQGDETEQYSYVYPQGKAKHGNERKRDKSNVRYATIGYITEYGTSKKQARPYMTSARSKSEGNIIRAEMEVWKKETGM